MHYELLFKLTNFIDARVEEIEDANGTLEKCVVIPIDKNNLYTTKWNNVFCACFVNEADGDIGYDATHNVVQKLSYPALEKITSLGYKVPHLGIMRKNKYKN